MARVFRPKTTEIIGFNMTPMIDCVFNLMIFFILTTVFVQLETEQVVLPMAVTAEAKDYTQFRNIVINIVDPPPKTPQIKVFGRVYEPGELTEYLRERKANAGKDEKLNVILRADAMVPYEDVARVMLAAGSARIEGWWITTEIEKPDKAQPRP
jgi:biopolymer transport protein ExbD